LLGDGAVAPNVVSALGIAGGWSLVPYVALVGGLVGRPIVAVCGWRGLALAVGIAAWLLAALALVPHGGPYAEHAYRDVVLPAVAR
jgi:hypothetical protein